MPITNAALAQQITELVAYWRNRDSEYAAWVSGGATDGPYGDGRFPLTGLYGTVGYVKSPAALQASVDGLVASALAYAADASDSADAAAGSVLAAQAARDAALGYQTGAQAARDLALSYKSFAASHEANAQAAATAAATSATDAGTAEVAAEAAQAAAEAARDLALGYRDDAADSATAAAASAAAAATFDPAAFALIGHDHDTAYAAIDHGHDDLWASYVRNSDGTKGALTMTDSWLRLNQYGQFTSGTYTPGLFAADGGLSVGSTTASAFFYASTSGVVIRTPASHLTLYETDGADTADRGLLEFNLGELNLYGWDASATTWRRFFGGNVSTGAVTIGSSATSGYPLSIQSATGYGQIGSANASYFHFYTDRAKFYFNKVAEFDGGAKDYGSGYYFLKTANGTNPTISRGTGAPAGGADGDIYFQYT
jgi:hypothetical protein